TTIPPQPPRRGIDLSQFASGSSGSGRAQVGLPVGAAFEQTLSAIQAAGGVIEWNAPPNSAKFRLNKRDFWNTGGTTVKYSGDVRVSAAGPQASLVDISMQVDWGSMVPIMASAILGAIVFSWMMPVYGSMLILLALMMAVLYAWQFASKFPTDTTEKILKKLPRADAVSQAGSPAAATPAYASGGASNNQAATATSTPADSSSTQAGSANIADRIKQLASLREAGAITQEEYDAKKAELLKEL
ncbi:MAG: hypothetical protein D6760_03530, partial [Deltaproteobacteria bacterium]